MSSKSEIIERFIASGQAGFDQELSYNDYYCGHHPLITPLAKKPPKDLDDATLQAFYFHLLLNGQTPPVGNEQHFKLLTLAAAEAAGVLEAHGYPRCRQHRWVMVLLFEGDCHLDAYTRKLALLNQVKRFAHQPGMLAKKQKLKAEFATDAWLHDEIARLLRSLPFARLDSGDNTFDLSLAFVGLLFIFLLGADEQDQRLMSDWIKQGTDNLRDIPNYKTRTELARPLAWILFRFAEAADAKVLVQALLVEYGETWCREYA